MPTVRADRTDVDTWENEGGTAAPAQFLKTPTGAAMLSCSAPNQADATEIAQVENALRDISHRLDVLSTKAGKDAPPSFRHSVDHALLSYRAALYLLDDCRTVTGYNWTKAGSLVKSSCANAEMTVAAAEQHSH